MFTRKIILLFVLSVFVMAVIGCSNAGNTVAPPEQQLNSDLRSSDAEGRVVWDTFRVMFNPADGSAEIQPIRDSQMHLNVTQFTKPPKCYDCVAIGGSQYSPGLQQWQLTVYLKNPAAQAAYDVRGLVFNLGNKYLKNTDGFMNKYLGQDMDYKAFAKADPARGFWPGAVNEQTYIFHFPPGENWNFVDYIVDASWPGQCKEPVVENLTFPAILNNGIDVATMTVTAFDHQAEFFVIMADLTPIGAPPTALFDDGVHEDGAAGDGVFGAGGITANAPEGHYMINVYGYDAGNHYGWNHTRVQVVGEILDPPVITEITMSRTTVKSGSSEKITLECVVENPGPGLQYDWTVTGGNLSVTNQPVTVWSPPSGVSKHIATCKVSNGSQFDEMDSRKMRVTSYSIIGAAPAPDWTAEHCVESGSFSLSDFCPGDAVLINFWATWCGPCIAEFPHLQDVQDEYNNPDSDFTYVELSVDSTKGVVTSWINSNSYDFDYWGWDQGSSIFSDYMQYVDNPGYIPTTVILDADCAVRFSKVGGISSPSVYTVVLDQLV